MFKAITLAEVLVPALPSFIIDPLWDHFESLLPDRIDAHPLGCHRPRVPNRVVFDKLIQVLVLRAAYERIADTTCSGTTVPRLRDEWITALLHRQSNTPSNTLLIQCAATM